MTAKRGALLIVGLAYAWFAAEFRPFTQPENAATAVPILVALGAALRLRRTPDAKPRGRPAGAWVWAIVYAALVVWELIALRGSPRDEHPTLSYLTDRLMSTHPGRAVVFAVWLALGALLVDRIARERAR